MRTFEVKVTEEVEYMVTVEAQNAEEAEEAAIEKIAEADDPNHYWAGQVEHRAEVQE